MLSHNANANNLSVFFSRSQDAVFDALSDKVAEVHRSCVDDRMANLNTLEKLANIENRLSLVLLGLESMPEEKLEMMNKIKDSEKRSRYGSLTMFCSFAQNQSSNKSSLKAMTVKITQECTGCYYFFPYQCINYVKSPLFLLHHVAGSVRTSSESRKRNRKKG